MHHHARVFMSSDAFNLVLSDAQRRAAIDRHSASVSACMCVRVVPHQLHVNVMNIHNNCIMPTTNLITSVLNAGAQ